MEQQAAAQKMLPALIEQLKNNPEIIEQKNNVETILKYVKNTDEQLGAIQAEIDRERKRLAAEEKARLKAEAKAAADEAKRKAAEEKAERDGIALGDTVQAKLLDGTEVGLVVQGVYDDDTFGNLIVDRRLYDGQAFPLFDVAVFVRTDGGVSADNTAALQGVLTDYPSAKLESRDEFIASQV